MLDPRAKTTSFNGRRGSRESCLHPSTLPLLSVSYCVLVLDSGPEDSPFEGGVFVAELVFPLDYPLSPPKMKFTSEMFHPNGSALH